jgi:hypothetical protein
MADAVFVGRVVNITKVEDGQEPGHAFLRSRRVTLEVIEKFRGDSLLGSRDGASVVEVFSGQGGGDCGIAFKKGEDYLVFASASKSEPTLLQTGLCDRTRELSRAQEDLPYLRALATSSPRGGRVYGHVELFDPDIVSRPPESERPEPKQMADVPVTLTKEGSAGVTKTASTNASGYYEFTDLTPGKYRVEATLPERYYVSDSSLPFAGELRDARGCSELNVHAAHDGRVSGRLLDARGKPVARVKITLLGTHDLDSLYNQFIPFMGAVTNGDGTYELTKVPPGRYVAAINADRDLETRQLLKPRIFHPGVERAGDATTINVGPGERVKLADWSMKP